MATLSSEIEQQYEVNIQQPAQDTKAVNTGYKYYMTGTEYLHVEKKANGLIINASNHFIIIICLIVGFNYHI